MTRTGYAALAASAVLALACIVWLVRPVPEPERGSVPTRTAPSAAAQGGAPKSGAPTLYCEFTNFADRTPLVGFYFRVEPAGYALVFRREQDGAQEDFVPESAPRWSLDRAADPAVLGAPDDETRINLYAYDPGRPGQVWFEAGLRSVRYRNLGGRCRHSGA